MSEIKSSHSVEETLHIQSLKLGQQLKRIIEQDAQIVELEDQNKELAAKLCRIESEWKKAGSWPDTNAEVIALSDAIHFVTPKQCLAEIRAEAMLEIAQWAFETQPSIDCFLDYIAKVRQGGE